MNTIIREFRKNKTLYTFYLPVTVVLFILSFLLLGYPQAAADGVKSGLRLCLETVVPSLFPFLLVSTVAFETGVFNSLPLKAERLTRLLFALPSVSLPIIAMSLVGGYPVGAGLIEKAFERGELTASEAGRLMMFCVNPGPAFAVSAVGSAALGSRRAGLILYIGAVLASLIIGLLSRFFAGSDSVTKYAAEKSTVCRSTYALTDAINSSTRAMLNICIWVIIFSCLGSLAVKLGIKGGFLLFFKMVSEVTGGAITAGEHFSLPVIAAVISFGGFCVHFQILPVIFRLRIRYSRFLAVRILSAAISCALVYLFINIFPDYVSVISLGTKPHTASAQVSFPVCVWLMIMCGLFIIGDNYVINKKADK